MQKNLEPDAFEREQGRGRKPNPVDVHVGNRLRLRRVVLGFSQEKLGDQLGLTFQQIQKYEKGVNRIGASRLYELSKVLGVGVAFFFEDLEDEAGAILPRPAVNGAAGGGESDERNVVAFLKSREGIELNRAFSQIEDARVRRSLIELVRNLTGPGAANGGR